MVTVELVLHQEKKRSSALVQDGVNDVDVTHHLYKNIIYFYVEDVLEKSQSRWDSES